MTLFDPAAPPDVEELVVALDGSVFAERAVPVAADLATRLACPLCLLTAVVSPNEVADRHRGLARVGDPHVAVRREVVVDPHPADAINAAITRAGQALACLASHGRGRSAALVGSVATRVVLRSHRDVVLVGPSVNDATRDRGVVLCIDETAPTSMLFDAVRWAYWFLEPLTVMTVAEDAPESPRGPTKRGFGPDGDVEAFLEAFVRPARDAGFKIRTVVVYDPVSPVAGARDYLSAHRPMLVVTGTHARTGLPRLLLGSVSAGIVHDSVSPVLVVPPPYAVDNHR